MRKVFWDDPYRQKLTTRVLEVLQNEVLFEETIIFSFSGGQESDAATVNGVPVISSRMEGFRIYYTFADDHPFKVGDSVEMVIDWPRRYALMRLHFAAELVLEIVRQKWQLERVGANIAPHKARIDFKYEGDISELFPEILERYNKIIEKDVPIEKGFSDEKNQRRYWKIDGLAKVPCGGTHVHSTKEVGMINLKRKKCGRGLMRIEMRLAD